MRRGDDPRTALGSERVPRVHFHLEQAEWPPGTVRLRARELASSEWVAPSQRLGGGVRESKKAGLARTEAGGRIPGLVTWGLCPKGLGMV